MNPTNNDYWVVLVLVLVLVLVQVVVVVVVVVVMLLASSFFLPSFLNLLEPRFAKIQEGSRRFTKVQGGPSLVGWEASDWFLEAFETTYG